MKWLITLFALVTVSFSQAPSAGQIKEVLEYYKTGSEVVLVENILCLEVAKSGEEKNNCVRSKESKQLAKGEKALFWMNFFIPKKAGKDVLVEFQYKGKTRKSKEYEVATSQRYRTWTGLPTNKVGMWTVRIEQESTGQLIQELSYEVIQP